MPRPTPTTTNRPYYIHRFKTALAERYQFTEPGEYDILFPDLKVDVKLINDRLNDSYSLMHSGTQMIQGLGYDILLFVYHQQSDFERRTVEIGIKKAIWVRNDRTADWYSTLRIIECLKREPLFENVISCIEMIGVPVHPGEMLKLVTDIIKQPPQQGYAAMGRAMKWHIRWGRVIDEAGKVDGIELLN